MKEYAKYLGILIDDKLSFKQHIQHVKSKLIRGNAILSMIRHYVQKNTLINTYNAYIQPHLDYGLNIWGHTYTTHLSPLKRQQRKAIRLMNFKPKRYETPELFINNNILPFEQNLQLSSTKLLWKAKHNLLPPTVNSLFVPRADDRSFHLPFRRLEIAQQSPTYRGVQTWNKIPMSIRSKNSLDSLKTEAKPYLISLIN